MKARAATHTHYAAAAAVHYTHTHTEHACVQGWGNGMTRTGIGQRKARAEIEYKATTFSFEARQCVYDDEVFASLGFPLRDPLLIAAGNTRRRQRRYESKEHISIRRSRGDGVSVIYVSSLSTCSTSAQCKPPNSNISKRKTTTRAHENGAEVSLRNAPNLHFRYCVCRSPYEEIRPSKTLLRK